VTDTAPGSPAGAVVVISPQARDALKAAARASSEREHGGILVGYRDTHGITIDDIIEVPDATAARTRYLRRESPARRALTSYLNRSGLDETLGYVGEWHTHPAPAPPSSTDHHAMRTMARRNGQPVALVVAALQADHRDVHLYALISSPERIRSRVAGQFDTAEIRID
jgi:integrative and conjugative element protein (TIGR02256 family)